MRAPHIILLANLLESVARGEVLRLIVEMPPRHSKSIHVSELFPAWLLGHNPDLRIINASYASGLATAFSRRVRNTIETDQYRELFPGTRLAKDSRSAVAWDLEGRHGGLIAAGVGSGITGHGADVLIIDDPVKDRASAESETIREATWDWYTSTARTRVHPGGAIIICQTRWHYDDLAGKLLAGKDEDDEFGDEWQEVKFPAIAETSDALGRKVGEPLWEDRYPISELMAIKSAIGTRDWTALYQQSPTDEEGAIFPLQWWKYYDPKEMVFSSRTSTYQFWDTAFKEGEGADYSVCATWTVGHDGLVYGRDWWKGQPQFPELKRMVQVQYDAYKPDAIYIEDAASGQSLIQELKRSNLPIRTFKADRSKEARAHAITPYIENGRVLLPEGHSFMAQFLEEHSRFPNAAHDDIVDTTTMALGLLARPADTINAPTMATKKSSWR